MRTILKELNMHHLENTKTFCPLITFNCINNTVRVEIETERLYIRSYKDEDLENCIKLYGDQSLTKYFDDGRPKSRHEVIKLTDENGKKFFETGAPFGLFSIFLKSDMSFIGQIDLIPLDAPETVEIGCIFDRKYHNQGYPGEALRAFLFSYVKKLNHQGYTYHGMSIKKVIATVHPANKASKRLVHNLGMTFEKIEERFGHPRLWFSLSSTPIAFAHVWQADEYKQNSSVQRDAALKLLGLISWRGNEQVLDVGCGDGKITAVIANNVPDGSVVGIDASQEMISFARQYFSTNNFSNLSFFKQDAQHLNYNQKFDVVFSSFALQWVRDIRNFFQRAYISLSSPGLLAAIIPLGISTALEESIKSLISMQLWAPYFEVSLDSIPKFVSKAEYEKIILECGYKLMRFDCVEHNIIFPSREGFEKYVIQWFVYLNYIPVNLKDVFFNQIINKYLENEPLLSTGEVIFKFTTLDVIASKITL